MKSSQRGLSTATGAWVAIFLQPLLLAACSSLAIPGQSVASSSVIQTYSDTALGIHFSFPGYLSLETDTIRERGPSGEIINMASIAAASNDPVVAVFVRVIEDPLRNVMFPSLYPPSDDTLGLLVVGEISDIEQDKTEANRSAAISASDGALIMRISGFHAASYRVGLDSRTYGHRYVRGALVITPTRDVSLYVIGSDEEGVRGSVDSGFIDSLWNSFLASIVIDY